MDIGPTFLADAEPPVLVEPGQRPLHRPTGLSQSLLVIDLLLCRLDHCAYCAMRWVLATPVSAYVRAVCNSAVSDTPGVSDIDQV